MIDSDFRVEVATWERDAAALRAVREPVFVIEQKVPVDEEWDALDPRSVHVLALDAAGRPIGTGRLTPENKIGRMAVLREWRGRGVGEAILRTLIEQARDRGIREVALHAQTHAIPFYARAGFTAEGAEFDECGIPHRLMRRTLEPRESVARPGDRVPPATPPDVLEALGIEQACLVVDRLAGDARHRLWIYSRDLDKRLYDREVFLDQVKRVALSGRGAEIRVLIHEPRIAVQDGHRLLHLAQRLPSFIQLRVPRAEEDLQYPSAFLLNDAGGYFFRPLGNRFEGEGRSRAVGRHGALREHFERVWERAESDPELRRLSV